MSLKFSLSGAQIRHFKHALQNLAKIGSELLLEGVPQRLILRSINSAKSAFMAVTFNEPFFEVYSVLGAHVAQAGILMKNLLVTFRSQKLARMDFDLDGATGRMRVTLACDNGLVKVYTLDCLDAEILQATVDRSSLATCVVAAAGELNKLLGTFHTSLEEITIIALPEAAAAPPGAHVGGNAVPGASQGFQQVTHRAVQLRSFYDPTRGPGDKALHTALDVDARSVFISYAHSGEGPADVTFNVRDLRALVALCEHMGAHVALRFEGAGLPLLAEPHFAGPQNVDYTAELVLATLMETQAQHYTAAHAVHADPAGPAAGYAQAGMAVNGGSSSGAPAGAVGATTPAAALRGPGAHLGAVHAPPSTVAHIPGDTPWHRTATGNTAGPGMAQPQFPSPSSHQEPPQQHRLHDRDVLRFNYQQQQQQQQQHQQLQQQQQQNQQLQQDQHQQRPAYPGAIAGSGRGGSGSSSGMSRMQRLEAELEAEYEQRARAYAPERAAEAAGTPASAGALHTLPPHPENGGSSDWRRVARLHERAPAGAAAAGTESLHGARLLSPVLQQGVGSMDPEALPGPWRLGVDDGSHLHGREQDLQQHDLRARAAGWRQQEPEALPVGGNAGFDGQQWDAGGHQWDAGGRQCDAGGAQSVSEGELEAGDGWDDVDELPATPPSAMRPGTAYGML